MLYKLDNGQVFRCETPAQFVRELHSLSFAPNPSDKAYMEETAKRTMQEVSGAVVRSDNADVFVADLVAVGKVKVEEE